MAISPRRRVEADDTPGPIEAIVEKAPGIDEVPKGTDYKKLFAEEKFMNELVTIILHPGLDASEIGVPVGVNGKRVYITPGRPCKVPRTHIAQLVKARPDTINHRSDDYNAPEQQMNIMYKQSTSKYNFDVIEDTPKGAAWLRELRAHHQRR